MFPADISACRNKKSAVLNWTPFTNGAQGVSGKGRSAGGVPGGRVFPLVSHGKPCNTMSSTDRKSTRLNSSHQIISYAVFCLKKKKKRGTSNEGDRTHGT